MAVRSRVSGRSTNQSSSPAPIAEHFGREFADVVGGGDDEDRSGLVLEPVQHRAEDPRTGATSVEPPEPPTPPKPFSISSIRGRRG